MDSIDILILVNLLLLFLLKIVCFSFGYLTVRLGYQLIKDGAKGEFKFHADISGSKADLRSVSPGLLFVVLGIGLIGYSMAVDKVIKPDEANPGISSHEKNPPPESVVPKQ